MEKKYWSEVYVKSFSWQTVTCFEGQMRQDGKGRNRNKGKEGDMTNPKVHHLEFA